MPKLGRRKASRKESLEISLPVLDLGLGIMSMDFACTCASSYCFANALSMRGLLNNSFTVTICIEANMQEQLIWEAHYGATQHVCTSHLMSIPMKTLVTA